MPTATPIPEAVIQDCVGGAPVDDVQTAALAVQVCLGGSNNAWGTGVLPVAGPLPVMLVDVAQPGGLCQYDDFIAWVDGGAWQLQNVTTLVSRGKDGRAVGLPYPILPQYASSQPTVRQVAGKDGVNLGAITSVLLCGSHPQESYILLSLRNGSWDVLWHARVPEITNLAHTDIDFIAEGVDRLRVIGDSWMLMEDPKRLLFHESNPGPHRYFEQTWVRQEDIYVMQSERVIPSAYNTLVEFVYRLSTGDDSGALALLTDASLLDAAKSMGLMQNPVGQEWLTNLDRDTVCCGPVRILGPPVPVTVSFVRQGEEWLVSDIRAE